MRLLRFSSTDKNQIDEVLMVVPDGYDSEMAHREAADVLDCETVRVDGDIELFDLSGNDGGWSFYRPFVG